MSLPPGYSVRPATRADAEEITRMFVEQELLLDGEAESTVEDLYDDWTAPGFEIERDTWVVTSDDLIVGYSGVVKQDIGTGTFSAYGGVHPEHWGRGLGAFLIESVEQRVAEKGGHAAVVRQWVDVYDKSAIALLKSRGYSFIRRFWRMDVDPAQVPEPEVIAGTTIRPFTRDADERAAHDVLERAFTRHWGYVPRTFEEAAPGRWHAEWFRPDLSLVAETDGQMVAVCINGVRIDDGFVEDLGVLEDYRGRGIGEALLRKTFQIFKEHGLRRASLSVDSDNSTGAMRLYERVGMTTGTCYEVYERTLLTE